MDIIILFGLFLVPAYLLQSWFGLRQMKKFSLEYRKMRQNGKVAIGRQAGKIVSGVIVLLSLDKNGFIVGGRKLQGTSVLAQFKDFTMLNGLHMDEVESHLSLINQEIKNTRKAVMDAVNNYNLVMNGKEIPNKKSLFKQLFEKITLKSKTE